MDSFGTCRVESIVFMNSAPDKCMYLSMGQNPVDTETLISSIISLLLELLIHEDVPDTDHQAWRTLV
ncbi:uncharacterized [Tachysurus ichikawai]